MRCVSKRWWMKAGRSRTADPATAVQIFERALGLWRGPALADLTDQASLQPEIARLEELRVAAPGGPDRRRARAGAPWELVPELETLVAEHPFRERLWLHLITALYGSDRQADALDAFQRARELLAEELGIDPSPELRRLARAHPPSGSRAGHRGGAPPRVPTARAGRSEGPSDRSIGPSSRRSAGRWRSRSIRPGLANDPEFIRRFEAEAQLVARLEHPAHRPALRLLARAGRRLPGDAVAARREPARSALESRAARLDASGSRSIDQVAAALAAAHRQASSIAT